ncbi:hypothetical protein DRO31_07240 [Candidatus Bathyarchaeota archaeon]|nr:MAG: hypothetical protein DRO31_07240 [Candidatus Bathyarchaeota archaeon]
MSNRRSSVQEAVRVIITQNPYLYRGLRMQVINYSAVARYIQDQVQDMAGNDVDPNTIVTAIMRFSREATEDELRQPESALSGARFNLVTDIIDVTIHTSPQEQVSILEQLYDLQKKGANIKVHQYQNSLKIITTSYEMPGFMQDLWQYDPSIKEGYAELNIQLAQETSRYDRIAMLTDLLFRHGVHLVDAFFSQTEISLIINEEDASTAFEVLRSQNR